MMWFVSASIVGLLIGCLLATALAIVFARIILKCSVNVPEDYPWPKASVILTLRGADPDLRATIEGLLAQDYPDFDLRINVDSQSDPSWLVVQDILAITGDSRMFVETLAQPSSNCGLVCSAIAQALDTMPEDAEVAIFVDADLKLHPGLLKQLVAPLSGAKIGATFGNRWYRPAVWRWGSEVRRLWNAAAVVPMYLYSIPWGGCMAIRREVLQQISFSELLRRSMVHDAPLKSELARIGQRLHFVPALMMLNDEDCSTSFCHNFIKRQMFWTRLYHPNFWAVLLHGILLSAVLICLMVTGAIASLAGHWSLAALSLGSIAAYFIWCAILLYALELAFTDLARRRNQPLPHIEWSTWLCMPVAVAMTHVVYCVALFNAATNRNVVWRGIHYRILGPHKIELLNYKPYLANSGDNVSI